MSTQGGQEQNPVGNAATPVPTMSNEELSEQMHHLHAALQTSLYLNEQLKQRSEAMEGNLNVALGRQTALKMATPEYFDGNRTKLENWIYQIRIYIFGNQAMFPDEARKVAFALTYLRGEAQDWSRPYIDATVAQQMPPELQDFELFLAQLRAAYGDVDPKGTASTHLLELQQTGSVAEYAAKFRAYKSLSGWNADDQTYKAIFRKNLKPQVRRQIAGKEPENASFSDYVNWVARVDEQLRLVGQETKTTNTPTRTTNNPNTQRTWPRPTQSGSSTFTSTRSNPPSNARDPNAMELDRVRRERQARGECFHCGIKGHISRFCPQRTTKAAVLSGEVETPANDHGATQPEPDLQAQVKKMVQQYIQEQACRANDTTTSDQGFD